MLTTFKKVLHDPVLFVRAASGITLRAYQVPVIKAVADSVFRQRGLSFVVMFPRQSGKNELQAQLEVYLLMMFSQVTPGCDLVKVSPTWKPQSLNAMRRLESVLKRNLFTRTLWQKESGYIYRVGDARITFLSGAPEANIVGATANTLLEVDEAQDVLVEKYDREIAPMAASTNATRVFWGTAWTRDTLLGRELRTAHEAEKKDGIQRVFRVDADVVSVEVPAYGAFVRGQVEKLGRFHPMVRTQFFSEEIEADGALFPPERLGRVIGTHPPVTQAEPGRVYALLVDVAGEAETSPGLGEQSSAEQDRRDSTAVTVVEVQMSYEPVGTSHEFAGVPVVGMASEFVGMAREPSHLHPVYHVVWREQYTGLKHTDQFSRIASLAERFHATHLVVDATGVGAGLASMLQRAFPDRVIPFIFNASTKSDLGWTFLNLVDACRFQDYALPENPKPEFNRLLELHALFLRQLGRVQYDIPVGPEKRMRWSVPEGARDPLTGGYLHDDLVFSAALVGVLEKLDWSPSVPAVVIPAVDPLKELDEGF